MIFGEFEFEFEFNHKIFMLKIRYTVYVHAAYASNGVLATAPINGAEAQTDPKGNLFKPASKWHTLSK